MVLSYTVAPPGAFVTYYLVLHPHHVSLMLLNR